MTFDLSPEQEQARTIEHMAWFIRHPEVWEGGQPVPGSHIPVISWPEGVEPAPVDSHRHVDTYVDTYCYRSAEQEVDGQKILHSYASRTECQDVCTTCDTPLTGDETVRCHRCEQGDDDTNEVA